MKRKALTVSHWYLPLPLSITTSVDDSFFIIYIQICIKIILVYNYVICV